MAKKRQDKREAYEGGQVRGGKVPAGAFWAKLKKE